MRKEQKRNIKYLKREEWEELRDCIDNVRDKLIIQILYATGVRVAELSKLKIEHIDFEERFISIPWENTKTRTARTVYVPRETLNDMRAYLRLTKRKKELLFRLTKRHLQQLVKKYSDKSGVACSAHTLRHTHVVRALMDKAPIAAVQKQVGHKRLTTTQIYSDLAPEQVREAYEGRRGK